MGCYLEGGFPPEPRGHSNCLGPDYRPWACRWIQDIARCKPLQDIVEMHFALPPRKTSHPPPYTRTYRSTPIRRKQLQFGGIITCAALVLVYLATRLFADSPERPPPGTPETVIVTLLDPVGMSKEYMNRITENRKHYAAKQGLYFGKASKW